MVTRSVSHKEVVLLVKRKNCEGTDRSLAIKYNVVNKWIK